jgi:hypothetical protein
MKCVKGKYPFHLKLYNFSKARTVSVGRLLPQGAFPCQGADIKEKKKKK